MVTKEGGFPPLPDFPPVPRPDFLPPRASKKSRKKYTNEILADTKKRAQEIFDHELKKWLENFEAKK